MNIELGANKLSGRKIYDITATLLPETTVYPGDPTLSIKSFCEVGDHSCFGLAEITMSNHMGTHIDFPSHVIKGGKSSSDYDLSDLSGNCLIIEVPTITQCITSNYIDKIKIQKDSIVFFKTKNSAFPKIGEMRTDYVYIDPDAAQLLVEIGIKMVGIDYISVDSIKNKELASHNIFLKNDVLIVENLDLRGIDPGTYEVQVAPLNIRDMDGLPSRVILSS